MIYKVYDNTDELNREAASHFEEVLTSVESPVLGLATGSTPVGLYKELIKLCKDEKISFKNASSFNLDEYVGLDAAHDQSYAYFMRQNLFDHVDINIENTHVPSGLGDNDKVCADYNAELEKHVVDIQILGIGSNGHIAFNEPGTSFDAVTHVVNLTEQSITDNARFFDSIDDVPKQAITMGLKNIYASKKIILIAMGENKADAVKMLIEDAPNTDAPCSILQNHDNVVVLLDSAAASKLTK